MYNKILVPVDLGHLDTLSQALEVVNDMARHYQAEVCYVSVTSSLPGTVAKTPENYQEQLDVFAETQSKVHGQSASAQVYVSADPAVDLDDILVRAVKESSADLVIMATHLPKRLDVIMPSNGSTLARHTDASVFLVRQHTSQS
jgi:nucleotide-binding universal stress UspA family protein